MTVRPAWISIAVAATILCGCASKQADNGGATNPTPSGVGGLWKGDGSSSADPTSKAMQESMSLNLKPDKTFSATMGLPTEGTWGSTGNTVTLKLTKLGGNTIAELHKMAAQSPNMTDNFDKPIVLELATDGKTLSVTQVQTGKPLQPMVFKRG